MEELELREDIRKNLSAIHRAMKKQESGDKYAFLTSKLNEWEQKIQNDDMMFRNLLAKGELNADPEMFQIGLDEERWALGILQLWILELETAPIAEPVDSVQSEPVSEDGAEVGEENTPEVRSDGLWNIKQVAKYLNLGVDYLYQLTRKGLIPHIKISNRVLFRKEELDQWVQERHS